MNTDGLLQHSKKFLFNVLNVILALGLSFVTVLSLLELK